MLVINKPTIVKNYSEFYMTAKPSLNSFKVPSPISVAGWDLETK